MATLGVLGLLLVGAAASGRETASSEILTVCGAKTTHGERLKGSNRFIHPDKDCKSWENRWTWDSQGSTGPTGQQVSRAQWEPSDRKEQWAPKAQKEPPESKAQKEPPESKAQKEPPESKAQKEPPESKAQKEPPESKAHPDRAG